MKLRSWKSDLDVAEFEAVEESCSTRPTQKYTELLLSELSRLDPDTDHSTRTHAATTRTLAMTGHKTDLLVSRETRRCGFAFTSDPRPRPSMM